MTALTLSLPSASTAIARTSAESIPPDRPIRTPAIRFFFDEIPHAQTQRRINAADAVRQRRAGTGNRLIVLDLDLAEHLLEGGELVCDFALSVDRE